MYLSVNAPVVEVPVIDEDKINQISDSDENNSSASSSTEESTSSDDQEEESDNDLSNCNHNQYEFKALFKRLAVKFNMNGHESSGTINDDISTQNNNKLINEQIVTTANDKNNANLLLTSSLSIKTLKYLYKLLALYKLEICKIFFYLLFSFQLEMSIEIFQFKYISFLVATKYTFFFCYY